MLPQMYQTVKAAGRLCLASQHCLCVSVSLEVVNGLCLRSFSILSSNAVLLSFPSKQTSYFSSVCEFPGITSSEIPTEFLSGEIALDFDRDCLWKILLPVRHV